MFYGEYQHIIDDKNRLILPSKFRDIIREKGKKVYLTRGLERCLFLFPESEWQKQEQLFKALPLTSVEARKFNRLYFSGASDQEIGNQGRLLIPQYLKDYAGITREVVLIGVSTRIEIWAMQSWQEFYSKNIGDFEKIAGKIINGEDVSS